MMLSMTMQIMTVIADTICVNSICLHTRLIMVFFLSGGAVQIEQDPPFVDIIQRMLFLRKGADGPVFAYKGIDKGIDKIKIPGIAGDLMQGKQRGHHAAVHVVPAGRRSLADLFHIPGGMIGAGFPQQTQDILINQTADFL